MHKFAPSFPSAALVAAVLSTVAFGAHARGDDDMPGMQGAGPSFGRPGTASQVARTVRIDMKDMRFGPDLLQVHRGETIRFIVANRDAVVHDFTLGDAATQSAHRKEMLEMSNAGMQRAHAEANAVTVEAGQSKTLVWQFAGAGKLEFDCDVPGHYEAGMKGVIAVDGP